MAQRADALLRPEKALFHKVPSGSAHLVRSRLAAFTLKAVSYFCQASPLNSEAAWTIVLMYSKRSAPLVGSAVVRTAAYEAKAVTHS